MVTEERPVEGDDTGLEEDILAVDTGLEREPILAVDNHHLGERYFGEGQLVERTRLACG
jgi:hypothetical protein